MEIISSLPHLPLRPADGHKGTFGTVAVFGGCCAATQRMLGAPALTALGALRGGCGLAKIIAPAPILPHIIALAPSATGIALAVNEEGDILGHIAAAEIDRQSATSQCLAVGPGLGNSAGVRAIVLRAIQKESTPLVLDADGLNALADIADIHKDFHAPAILTPHPGEFARLAAALAITVKPVDAETRLHAAGELARRVGSIVVLKGAGTVVSDGLRAWVCAQGGPVLGTAGTGDCLTGLIAGLCAQHFTGQRVSLFDLARAGVLIHARAGEAWSAASHASGGMLAHDLLNFIPAECERLRSSVL